MQYDDSATPTKPNLIAIRDRHHFDITELAQAAMVHPETVYMMLLGEPVPYDFAVAILVALSEHAGEKYTLENVDVRLTPERGTL